VHASHVDWPARAVAKPGAHATQAVWPNSGWAVPAPQEEQVPLAIVPGGHALHWLEPAVDIMPARQLLHAVAAAVAEYLLAAHGWQL